MEGQLYHYPSTPLPQIILLSRCLICNNTKQIYLYLSEIVGRGELGGELHSDFYLLVSKRWRVTMVVSIDHILNVIAILFGVLVMYLLYRE